MHRYENNRALSTELAHVIAEDLRTAIVERGEATLAVSGGSTPAALFEALSVQALDWSCVSVTLVDERWVAEEHSDSNAALVRALLLQNNAAEARFVGMKTAADSPFDAEETVAHNLAAFAGTIDVVVLGMGEDGHTASFFPGSATLSQALDPQGNSLCVAVEPPLASQPRMTLALPALLRARHLYLHITGAGKLAVLERALLPGNETELPVRSVLHAAQPSIEIYYADRN